MQAQTITLSNATKQNIMQQKSRDERKMQIVNLILKMIFDEIILQYLLLKSFLIINFYIYSQPGPSLSLICTVFTERSAAPQITLWGGPRAEIRTRDGRI